MTAGAGAGSEGLGEVRRALRDHADPEVARSRAWFFKTGPGEYGEGDRFVGVRVPQIRILARRHRGLAFDSALELLRSPWHEERLLALLILVEQYRRGTAGHRAAIYDAYLGHTEYVNNWDLVDASVEHIVGAHLRPDDTAVLETLAASASVWERRMAIVATFGWIKAGVFEPTIRIARLLLRDPHDLIRKAVGWMLREVGKRDVEVLETFLEEHYDDMPRTMLRYAIERLPEARRRQYLLGDV